MLGIVGRDSYLDAEMLILENQPNVGAGFLIPIYRGFLILIHREIAPTAAQPVGRDSHLDISLSILENRPTEIRNHLKWIKSNLIC